MSRTKRSQNKCKTCSYTWYPRGKNLSHKCPKCGSEDVGYAKGGLILGAVVVAAFALFGGKKTPEAPTEPVAQVAPVVGEASEQPEPHPIAQPSAMPPQAPVEQNVQVEETHAPPLDGPAELPSTTPPAEKEAKPVSNELY